MSEQIRKKLNVLLQTLGDADLVSARWLRAHGYSTSLVARYVSSGWLQSPARGVYTRPKSAPRWDGVLRTLQRREGVRVHAGGRFALAWHGHEHYLRLGEAAQVTLYGPDRLPRWATQLALDAPLVHCGRGPFAPATLHFDQATDEQLHDEGLELQTDSNMAGAILLSSPERAILELSDDRPDAALVHELDTLLQGLTGLRPELLTRLLQRCRSIKAKRLFLALAERHRHAWLQRVALDRVDLGSGKRMLVSGGRLHPKYLITLPADLGEQLG